jgi:catechol 2,3-dioxygenase-like lactoylglutathione lyase family enzyme
MTINAILNRLVLSTPQLEQMANFYSRVFGYRVIQDVDECRCEGDGRSLWLKRGAANQLLESHFVFPDTASLERYAAQLKARGVVYRIERRDNSDFLVVRDPDHREVWFGVAAQPSTLDAGARPARLQHYAVRNPVPQELADFYVEALGFKVSDRVRDAAGDLTAIFTRTDPEHHALAIFRAPEKRFDHFSCETRDWNMLRDWADHMSECSVPLAWGVGRHGPGNDTFFMVYDPDDNLAEISADLETCAEDRPEGLWEHKMETLNKWGVAIMRS